jgi:fibronectin-binding autotransporter adhesin
MCQNHPPSALRRRLLSAFTAAGLTAALAPSLHAAARTWTGGQVPFGDNSWATNGNWSGNAPVAADTVTFAAGGSGNGTTVTNSVSASRTISSLSYTMASNSTAGFHRTQIDFGTTLTVSNSTIGTVFNVGYTNTTGNLAAVTNALIQGTGALSIAGNSTSAMVIRGASAPPSGGSSSGSNTATLDTSLLSRFTVNVSELRIGATTSAETPTANTTYSPTGIWSMGANTTITAATSVTVGSHDKAFGGDGSVQSRMNLGNVTTMNTGTLNIGLGKALGTVAFLNPGANSTFKLRAANGTGRADINLGTNSGGYGASSSYNGTLDLSGGSADLLVGTLTAGERMSASGAGTTAGTLNFGAGTFDATTIILGRTNTSGSSNTSSSGLGTLNISGGTTTIGTLILGLAADPVTAPSSGTMWGRLNQSGGNITVTNMIELGSRTSSSANSVAESNLRGSITISDGIFKALGGISEVNTSGNSTVGAQSSLTLTGGTLDLNGQTLAIDTPSFQQGTLQNVGEISSASGPGNSDNLLKSSTGTLVLTGNNSYTGLTRVQSGILNIRSSNALGAVGNGTIVSSGASLYLEGGITTTAEPLTLSGTGSNSTGALRNVSGNNTYSGLLTLGADTSIFSDSGSLSLSHTGTITGNYNLSLGATGSTPRNTIASSLGVVGRGLNVNSGTWVLTGASTYTGVTNIFSGGTLILNGSLANTPVSVLAGATLGGSGTIGGTVSVTGTLAPGNSPGALATGAQTWNPDGDYNWQILNATGLAGVGYDTLNITGGLDLTGLSASAKFAINLWSLSSTGPDVSGDALNFDNALAQSWTLVSTTTSVTGFNASFFDIFIAGNNGTAGFSNTLDGTFSLALSNSGRNLDLVYTPTLIPEPASVAALSGLAALAAMATRRRRRA